MGRAAQHWVCVCEALLPTMSNASSVFKHPGNNETGSRERATGSRGELHPSILAAFQTTEKLANCENMGNIANLKKTLPAFPRTVNLRKLGEVRKTWGNFAKLAIL